MSGGRRPILRGQRVFLRPAERDEVGLLAEWMNDAEVMETLGSRGPISDAAEEAWFDELQQAQGKTRWHLLICLHKDDRPVGVIALESVDGVNGQAELGIGICEPALWDQGYGTEATEVMLDFAFGELRLHRVFLHVFSGNERAVRVYGKAGFVHEGTKRESYYRHGRYHDTHVMGILAREWTALERPRTWEIE